LKIWLAPYGPSWNANEVQSEIRSAVNQAMGQPRQRLAADCRRAFAVDDEVDLFCH
jgi:hypothetical protein